MDSQSHETALLSRFGSRYWSALSVAALVAVAAGMCVKVSLLGSRELWLDETYSAFVARLPFRNLLAFISGDVHPKLFSVLLWLWVRIASDTQRSLRLFSVLVNALSVAAMISLGRRTLGLRWGIFATVLFAFSPILLFYSLEVRSYMLLVLVFLCATLLHWRVTVEGEDRVAWLLAYSLLLALMFYVHYLSIFLGLGLFVMGCCIWVARRLIQRVSGSAGQRVSGSEGQRVILCYAAALLLIAPGLPLMVSQHRLKVNLDHQLQVSHQEPDSLSFNPGRMASRSGSVNPVVLSQNLAVVTGFYPAASRLVFALCAFPLTAAFAWAGYLGIAKRDKVCSLFLIVGVVLTAGVLALHFGNTRYFLPLAPLAILALSRSLQDWTGDARWRGTGLCAGVALLAIYGAGFARQATKPHAHPWDSLVRVVRADYQPGDTVVFDALYAEVPFDYFAREENFRPQSLGFPISIYDWWTLQDHRGWGGPVILRRDLDRFAENLSRLHGKTVWLVLFETSTYDPREALLGRLSELGEASEVILPPNPDTRRRNSRRCGLFEYAFGDPYGLVGLWA